jgi:hypothetical protein
LQDQVFYTQKNSKEKIREFAQNTKSALFTFFHNNQIVHVFLWPNGGNNRQIQSIAFPQDYLVTLFSGNLF